MVFGAAGNYPPGVSDAHPYFNPAPEVVVTVTCESEECCVVPSYAVKAGLYELEDMVKKILRLPLSQMAEQLPDLQKQIVTTRERVEELEDRGDYECPFEGEVEAPGQQAEAEYDCPVCGEPRKVDTIDEPDPDRGWDDRE